MAPIVLSLDVLRAPDVAADGVHDDDEALGDGQPELFLSLAERPIRTVVVIGYGELVQVDAGQDTRLVVVFYR